MKLVVVLGALLAVVCVPWTSADSSQLEPSVTSDSNPTPRPNPKDIAEPMLEPYYVMANWFVEDLVQLSYLYELEDKLGTEFTSIEEVGDSWVDNWEEWSLYFIGYSVCASVGVVLIIAMPIVGGVVACCRCCGNCGAKTPPGDKGSNCQRYGCGIALLIVTAALAFGTAGLFIANEEIRERLAGQGGGEGMGDTNMFAELGMSIDALDMYLDNTLDQLNVTVLGQYIVAKNNLFDKLDTIPQESIDALDDETGVVENLNELSDFTYGLPETRLLLEKAKNTTLALNTTLIELEGALEGVTVDITTAIENCSSETCNETRSKLDSLEVGVTTDGIDFVIAITAIDVALAEDLPATVNQSVASLESVSDEVETAIKPPIDAVKKPVNDAQDEIVKFINELQVDVDQIDFESATKALDDAAEDTEDIAAYIYWSVLSLGIILCVTLLCNVVGAAAGMMCPRPTPLDSGACTMDSGRGADWLLAGLSFTFIFYWLYTVIVLATFLAGGITQTEVCTHAVNYNQDNSAQVLKIYDRMINTSLYDSTGVQVEFFKIYAECAGNISFYRALELENRGYNISDILDLSEIEAAIAKIKDVTIPRPSIDIINDTLESNLQALDTGLNTLAFDEYYAQLENQVVTEDLNEIADMLVEISNEEGNIPELLVYAAMLENLTISHVIPATVLKTNLTHELMMIEAATSSNLTAIASNLTEAQDTINVEGETILNGFLNETVDDIYADIVAFSHQLETDVRENVGRCFPMFEAITGAIDATCVKTLYPLNGFWYSLGWILFWFIPSIVLSFVLVTQFRITRFRYQAPIYHDDVDQPTIDAYAAQNPSHMLIAPSSNSFVNEFDNPVYDNGDFKIPRPSLKSDAPSAEFKIPRPQVYDNSPRVPDSKNSSPPSYRSTEENSTGVNPSAEDTRL